MNRILTTLLLLCSITLLEGCISIKEPTFIEVRNMNLDKMGLASSSVKMDLVYSNPNAFSFQVLSSSFDLYIDNTFLGHAQSDSLIRVDKKSAFALPLTLQADMKNLFRNALSMMVNKTVLVQAKGTITVKAAGIKKSLPLNYEGRHEMSFF